MSSRNIINYYYSFGNNFSHIYFNFNRRAMDEFLGNTSNKSSLGNWNSSLFFFFVKRYDIAKIKEKTNNPRMKIERIKNKKPADIFLRFTWSGNIYIF